MRSHTCDSYYEQLYIQRQKLNQLQIHGKAMGTRMTPFYSYLFLTKFEIGALSRAPYQPHTQWRYIFMLWTHSVDDLHAFTSYLNSIHPTIKFTSNYLFTSIPFLDAKVFLDNGNITTDLYTKASEKHHHLQHFSCHPKPYQKTKKSYSIQLNFQTSSYLFSLTSLSNNVLMNSDLTLTNVWIKFIFP